MLQYVLETPRSSEKESHKYAEDQKWKGKESENVWMLLRASSLPSYSSRVSVPTSSVSLSVSIPNRSHDIPQRSIDSLFRQDPHDDIVATSPRPPLQGRIFSRSSDGDIVRLLLFGSSLQYIRSSASTDVPLDLI